MKNSSLDAKKLIMWGGLGLIILLAAGMGIFFRTEITRLIFPVPTPQCVQPVLKIGSLQMPIKSIARAADGSLPSPEQSDSAYWVDGTTVNYVFELNPAAAVAEALNNSNPGDPVNISWADCSTDEFVVSSLDYQKSIDPAVFDQTKGGVTILLRSNQSAATFVIQAVRPGALTTPAARSTDENAVQLEISFLDQSIASDGKTLTMTIAIKNSGAKAITLSGKDISLTVENAAPAAPASVDPALPQEIQPGTSQKLAITFPKPAGNTAVFKLLEYSSDIYY